MIYFVQPWYFLLIIPVIILGVFMAYRRRPAAKISTVAAFRRVPNGRRHFLTAAEWALLAAMLLGVCAMTRPRSPLGKEVRREQGIDIVLALDMSQSMACYDKPADLNEQQLVKSINDGSCVNRLENAKNEIRRFIEARPNDRIGLIGFADLAYSFVPPTLDHALLLERLQSLSPGELGDATGIASPIGTGTGHLKDSDAPRRVLVLFTDGANTAENRLSPQDAAKAAGEFNVIIHTVGIGSPSSYAVDRFNRLVKVDSQADNALLAEISSITGGNFYQVTDPQGMKKVMDEINTLEKTSGEKPEAVFYREYAPYIAALAALILVAGSLISCTGRVRLP
jgi:Ca-activated chloride channel family protein